MCNIWICSIHNTISCKFVFFIMFVYLIKLAPMPTIDLTKLTLEEIERLVKSGGSTELESSINAAVVHVLKILLQMKEREQNSHRFGDPDGHKLIALLNRTIAEIEKKTICGEQLTLPETLRHVMMSEDLHCAVNAFARPVNIPNQSKFDKELVSTAEQWIAHLKTAFTSLNHTPKSFADEKMFWAEICTKLNSIYDFSISADFNFAVEMLRRTGHLSLMYTLNILVADARIHRISQIFQMIYNGLDFTVFKVIDEMDISVATSLSNNQFDCERGEEVEKCVLGTLKVLQNMKKLPRIARKSVCGSLNVLRTTILRAVLMNYLLPVREIATEFASLAMLMNDQNECDLVDSRILIDHVVDLREYEEEINEIQSAWEFMSSAASTTTLVEINTLFIDLVRSFKTKILQTEKCFDSLVDGVSLSVAKLLSFFDSDAISTFLTAKATEFTAIDPADPIQISEHYHAYDTFFKHPTFVEKTKEYTLKHITKLGRQALVCRCTDTIYNNYGTREELLIVVSSITLAGQLLVEFQTLQKIADGATRLIDPEISALLNSFHQYIRSLPSNILKLFIIDLDVGLDLSTVVPDASEMHINQIGVILIEEELRSLRKFAKMVVPTWNGSLLVEEIRAISDGYLLLNTTLDEYQRALENGYIAVDQQIEEYFQGLVRLRWEYFREELMIELRDILGRIRSSVESIDSKFAKIEKLYIPEWLKNQEGVEATRLIELLDCSGNDQGQKYIKGQNKRITAAIVDYWRHEDNRMTINIDVDESNALVGLQSETVVCGWIKQYKIGIDLDSQTIEALNKEIRQEIEIINYEITTTICVEPIISQYMEEIMKLESARTLRDRLMQRVFVFFRIHVDYDDNAISARTLELSRALYIECYEYMKEIGESTVSLCKRFRSTQNILDLFRSQQILCGYLHRLKLFINHDSAIRRNLQSMSNVDGDSRVQMAKKIITELCDLMAESGPENTNGSNVLVDLEMLSLVVFGFDSTTMSRDELAKMLRSMLEFQMNPSLDGDEFGLVKSKWILLDSEIKSVISYFCDFQGDEVSFKPLLAQFALKCAKINEELAIYNKMFVFYKFDSLLLDVSLSTLECEYEVYSRKMAAIKTFRNNPLMKSTLNMADLYVSDDSNTHTQLLRGLVKDIENMKFPVECLVKLWELPQDAINRHFCTSRSIGEYLDSFDHDQMKQIAEKIKLDVEIYSFIHKKQASLGEIAQLDANSGFFMDLELLQKQVDILRSNLDMILKFNKYGLYRSELERIESTITKQQATVKALHRAQERIIEMDGLFARDHNKVETAKFADARRMFKTVIQDIKSLDDGEIHDKLIAINSLLDEADVEINTTLELLRTKCNRLYFISNNTLIRFMNGHYKITAILSSLFNIDGIVVTDNAITAITGDSNENVILKEPVDITAWLPDMVNRFEKSLKQTLYDSFWFKINRDANAAPYVTQEISIVDELVNEYKYFEGMVTEIPRRIERVLEYSKSHEDFISIFPRPALPSDNAESVSYSFEYYPPTNFILTEITVKVFSTIRLFRGMAGVILYGPTGTGKTETVKYYCRSIGKQLFTFCCNEKCTFESVRNIIHGCELTGSFICFDEFNRLSSGVMSAVTDLIYEKKDVIKMFLTMNLGYLGRSRLPKTLKSIFGEILVDSPETRDIVNCATSNPKFYDLIVSLRRECGNAVFYDFGLRAIKAIFNGNNDDEYLRNLVYFYMAIFSENDRLILYTKIREIFGTTITALGLDTSYENILRNAIKTRGNLLIFGGYGKTTLIRKLAFECQGQWIGGKKNNVFRYNPLNILLVNETIFGSVDKKTKEWIDSAFLSDLKESLLSENEVWFVFDGPINSRWIEDFNSVLDDNRMLCLVTGERIKIPQTFKFIFESDGIHDVTPATLTRLFLINLPDRKDCNKKVLQTEKSENPFEIPNMLDPEQVVALYRLAKTLETENVVFLTGPCGIGKKRICKELSKQKSIQFRCVNSANDTNLHEVEDVVMIAIDTFEYAKVSLQEQIRELWEYGEIGGVKKDNLRIICCIDSNTEDIKSLISSRLMGIRQVFISCLADVKSIICSMIGDVIDETPRLLAASFIEFLYKTSKPHGLVFDLSTVVHFIRLIDIDYINENPSAIAGHLYFICEIIFGKIKGRHCALLKKYLNEHGDYKIEPLEFSFESGLQKRDTDEHPNESRLAYALEKKCNAVVMGPRLSGKKKMVENCIEKLAGRAELRVIEWSRVSDTVSAIEYEFSNGSKASTIFILLEDRAGFGEKFLRENCIIIDLASVYTTVDLVGIVHGERLEKVLVAGKYVDTAKKVAEDDVASIDQSFNSLVEEMMQQSNKYITLPNFFKTVCFYRAFSKLWMESCVEFERRRKFMRNGIDRIARFSEDAAALRESIEHQHSILVVKQDLLEKAIVALVAEQQSCSGQQEDIRRQQEEINKEVNECESKKSIVRGRLEGVEQLLEESRKSISQLTKQHLSEIKAMNNPPEAVRRCIESTYLMLEETLKVPDWTVLQTYLKKDDFIYKIFNFDGTTNEISEMVKDMLLNKWEDSRIESASKTCAVLYRWISAVIRRNEMMNELLPLREDVCELEKKIARKNSELSEKAAEVESVIKRVALIEEEKAISEQTAQEISENIEKLKKDLDVLVEIVRNFDKESEDWKYIKLKNILADPLFVQENSSVLLDWCKVLYINRHDLESEEFVQVRGECIEVCLDDINFKKTVANAIYFDRDLLITAVDRFDLDVYELLKKRMQDTSTQCGKMDKGSRIFIQSDSKNWFGHETFELKYRDKFTTLRESNLEQLENKLLDLLNAQSPSLDEIHATQIAVQEERTRLRNEEKQRVICRRLNLCYERLDRLFTDAYGVHLSFGVFNEFANKMKLLDGGEILNTSANFFSASFKSNDGLSKLMGPEILLPTDQFDVREVLGYKFDYVFITSFSDILFQLKGVIQFDIEISAGSPENNTKITSLLKERGSRMVLVKNIHFLPPVINTGTNRFIFIIENGERHPLLSGSRIVYVDKEMTFESIMNGLVRLFEVSDEASMKLIRFHTAGVILKYDFGLKDLDVCLRSSTEFDPDFLIEIVYLSRLNESEKADIRSIVDSMS